MYDAHKCPGAHSVAEYLRLAEQCERAAKRAPAEANEFLARAAVFRRLAAKRKPTDARENNFYK
jgi:hypothetical protein